MFKRIIVFLAIWPMVFKTADAQLEHLKDGYLLSCTFKGLPNGTKIYLTTQQRDTIQSTTSNGDKFEFVGRLAPEGRFLFITFDSLIMKVSSKSIFVVNKPIAIEGKIGQREVVVKGSIPHEENLEVLKAFSEYGKEINLIYDAISNASSQLQTAKSNNNINKIKYYEELLSENIAKKDSLSNIRKESDSVWILSHKESLYTPYYLMIILASDKEFTERVYHELPLATQKSYYGRELAMAIDLFNKSRSIVKGLIIPNLNVIGLDGQERSILEIVKNNKLTLIDCWASWCTPCRAAIPKLKDVYSSYKSKGFQIIGISSDENIEDWKKAVEKDTSPWFQFIEDKQRSFTKMFNLGSIPAYILIDNNGKMLAFDRGLSSIEAFGGRLRDDDLIKTIETELNYNN